MASGNNMFRGNKVSWVRAVSLLLLLAAGGAAYWYGTRPAAVAVVAPIRGDAAEIVYASGVIEPRSWAKVTSLVRERIVSVCNCEGETVTQGTELARLDDTESQATLAELRARLRLAKSDYERVSALVARNIVSRSELDRATSQVSQIEALISGQEARLGSYILRAPGDGMVLRQDGEVGEIAEPGDVLFWVGRPTPLLVVAEVNEEDIPRVVTGQRALLRSDAFPERMLEATVDSITPKGDPVAKTYRVRLALPADTPLMIGMSVDVNIVIRVSEAALLIPGQALRGDTVFIVEDGTARRQTIQPGIQGITHAEVRSGLPDSAQIITPFPETLEDGARVTARRE